MTKFIKNNYRTINIIILCICIYIFCLPIISKLLEAIFPGLTYCPFLAITGKPCPLCGGTRFIEGIPKHLNDIKYFLNVFGLILIIIICEFIFRIINVNKKEFTKKYMEKDIIIHIILISLFFLYEIIYVFLILKE